MIKKIADFVKWKKWLLVTAVILSFALLKSFSTISTNAVNGLLLSIVLVIGFGIFYWLIFEVLIGFMYSGLKIKIEKNITMQQFNNVFRFLIIFCNLILFILSKIIILINFYANFMLLFMNIIVIFIFLLFMWKILKKYFVIDADKSLDLSYLGFVFMYLFLHTIMWGVL